MLSKISFQAINEALNMYSIRRTFLPAIPFFVWVLNWSALGTVNAQTPSKPNLSSEKWIQRDFWVTLDGKDSSGHWDFTDGEIKLSKPRGGSGSLLSPPIPQDFELAWKWKIASDTNSGLKYRVHQHGNRWLGLEYQIIDEKRSIAGKSSTGSIYDLIAPLESKPLKPAGQWNYSKIIAVGNHIQHFLNGELIAELKTSGTSWDAVIAKSKFWGVQGFADTTDSQRIMLTDHGGEISFKEFQWTNRTHPTTESERSKGPYLANGIKNGWIDQTSAVIWTRTTAIAEMNRDGPDFIELSRSEVQTLENTGDEESFLTSQLPPGHQLSEMLGSCPGAQAEIRLSYFPEKQNKSIKTTDWVKTHSATDYTHQWKLENLSPGLRYAVVVEARPVGDSQVSAVIRGHFQTAPSSKQEVPIKFCLTTCHDFLRRDNAFQGHKIYPSMEQENPDFVIHAGDIEYYDKPLPWALTKELMRFKWSRIFSLPSNRAFYTNHTSYFLKDDHDTLKNDCWPGQTYGSVTFEQGRDLFNDEQFPTAKERFTTINWGKDLQIWLLEGRDFRSPNNIDDGPEKSILGSTQKKWLFQTLNRSEAKFKLIISPTPIIGPDRNNKRDNHANIQFKHEGNELRKRLADYPGTIIFCGDRHWQYASEDEETGLWEFGCGPGSEKHQLGWREGDVHSLHRFLRVAGGFLSGELSYPKSANSAPRLTLRHHKVTGEIVSEFNFE